MSVIMLQDDRFDQEVLLSDKPVLVDFYADWCGPCKMVSPVIEEIAAEREDIKVVKVNVDDQPRLAERFGVASIPMILVFKDGEVYRSAVGARPKQAILELLD
ncbi:MAG: thioredoxin [Clostridia bacterium]|nr:thioredoxin [Clostridia bacterium]